MRQIGAFEAKNRLSELLNLVENGEEVVITKHGRPVAKLIPFAADSAGLIGSLAGRIHIKGEIFSTGLHWNVEP